MSAFSKNVFRQIKDSFNRFIAIFGIVALGVGFFAGLKATSPVMKASADQYYDRQGLMDLRIVSATGLTKTDVDEISGVDGVQETFASRSIDALAQLEDGQRAVKLMAYSPDTNINRLTVVEGRLPENDGECVIDNRIWKSGGISLGSKMRICDENEPSVTAFIDGEYTIVGVVQSPYYHSIDRESTSIGNGALAGFVCVPENNFRGNFYTEVYLTVSGAAELLCFGDEYAARVDEVKQAFSSHSDWYILDRDSNIGVASFEQNSDKIDAIASVFPIFFFLVAALVCLTTMTRMIEEQRTQIGVLKSLGYSKLKIAMKYLIYADLASVAGCVIGLCAGYTVFPSVIIRTYDMLYDRIPVALSFNVPYAVISSAAALVCISGATLWACLSSLSETPAQLVRPKAPAKGKKVFLERIGFLWRRLSFTQKVTARNLIRYKKRFFMTVIGIGGCTALLLTGFGLSDSISGILPMQFEQLQHTDMTLMLKDASYADADTELNKRLHENFSQTVYLKQSTVDVESDAGQMSVYLVVPESGAEFTDFMTLRHRTDRTEVAFPHSGGAVVSEKLASKLGLNVGDTFLLKSGDVRGVEVTVGDICENYTYNYVYMSPAQYESLYDRSPAYTTVWGLFESDFDGEEALAAELLETDNVEIVSRMSQLKTDVANILQGLNGVVVLIVICASALAFIVLYNLTNINITERIREIATIKVLGFRSGEVSAYIYRENIVLTLIGTVIGLVLGIFLHGYVITTAEVDMVMFVRQISPLSFLYAALFTAAFSALVNIVAHFSLKRVDMIESLKSVE